MKRKEPKYKYNHVMILDDSELDNFINQKTIESSCFSSKVYVNTSSKSALEFLKNISVVGELEDDIYPEVIFIDLNMPIINGFQFISFLKEMDNKNLDKCKLVILTSSVHPEDRKKAAELKKDIIFLNKPLTESMLADL